MRLLVSAIHIAVVASCILLVALCSARAAYLTGTVIPLDGGILRSAF